MINFTCKCGHQFSMAEDTAGGSLQCPDCKLLVDIPYLSDLQNLEEDGTFMLSPELQRDEQALEDLARTAGRHPTDDDEIYDLRPTPEDIMNAGVEEIPRELKDQLRPGAPKYDPETGELIRPMELKADETPLPQDIPVAKPALNYASGDRLESVPPWSIPWALLRPANLVVLAVVFFIHLLNQGFVLLLAGGFFLMVVAPVSLLLMIVAHYANVIDEIGRQERDELPGLLRNLSWSDDIWHPFVAFAGALILSYFPAYYAVDITPPLGPLIALALVGAGTCLFPAVLLTTATSGSVFNLRPDRLLSVIRHCGSAYLVAILLWAAAGSVYVVGLVGITAHAAAAVRLRPTQLPLHPLIAYPLLLAGVYLMHLFAWHMGLLYRQHQPQFSWVLQHHVWSRKDEKDLQALRRQRTRRQPRKTPRSTPRVAQPAPTQPAPASPPTKPLPVQPLPVQSLSPRPVQPLPPPPPPPTSFR